jgi:hypothetical protein
VVDVILCVLVLPHVLFLAHGFEEAPVKDRAVLMYPRGV